MIKNTASSLACEDIFDSAFESFDNSLMEAEYCALQASMTISAQGTCTNFIEENFSIHESIAQESAPVHSYPCEYPSVAMKPLKVRKFPSGTSDRDIVHSVLASRPSRDEPFYIVNLSKVESQIMYMRELLPRVDIYYAVKCNSNKRMIERMNSLGVKFDCASRGEMKLVEKTLGITSEMRESYFGDSVIFANPCKQISHIRYAREIGVKMVVVDSLNEMRKMAAHYPEADLVIRIKVEDANSKFSFSSKFGASLDDCPTMLQFASDHNQKITGVSFHVGSGCGDASQYIGALERSRTLFDMAKEYGFKMTLLDIGGGFPGTENGDVTFKKIAEILRDPLDQLFDPAEVRVIAEPGRFVATQSHILLCNVFSRKEKPENEATKFVYYVNDSLYGSFSCIIADHATPIVNIYKKEDVCIPTYSSNVYGCTCDSIDIIFSGIELPVLDEGTWLYFFDFGAYTKSCSSSFNGFSTNNYVYVEYD